MVEALTGVKDLAEMDYQSGQQWYLSLEEGNKVRLWGHQFGFL